MNLQYKPARHLKFNMHGAFGYGTLNWIKVLVKNKFLIQPAEIPKVIWITLSIFSTNVFRIYEGLLYNNRVKKVTIKEPVFIIGFSRSGTTYLHYLISKDNQFSFCATYQVLMPNLFLTMGVFLEKFLRGVLPKTRLMDNLKMATTLPKEEEFALSAISDASMVNGYYFPKNIMKYFNRYVLFLDNKKYEEEWKKKYLFFLKKVALNQQNKKLLLKSPFNTGRIKEILAIFPDAKFIHIHRNPHEVYYSNERLYEKLLPAFGFHEVTNEFMENFILDAYTLTYEKYFKDIELIPAGSIATLTYEELVNTPIEALKRVYAEIGLNNIDSALPKIEAEISSYHDYKTNSHAMEKKVMDRIDLKWGGIYKKINKITKQDILISEQEQIV